mmetsp:Transcript_2799/g.3760  ORF Transcript_2799/g.3760 Transcript_2799/m.3760 type:complete len:279 (-) Transcript_2799:86-922(-)|eukprot:CAMPEP_0198145162 /NCGR_PEP_ID=MMETSP1443-20131203/21400_1 /TAXON_ID=186043 /ORGANISM="Entomoneis sp., Strain CCMP2396" /LENGTH=278 /DNA_ID=CAMNT_0043808717 /DNA_START=29 /DNA_END=865 /DNA_ORIENTATION=+
MDATRSTDGTPAILRRAYLTLALFLVCCANQPVVVDCFVVIDYYSHSQNSKNSNNNQGGKSRRSCFSPWSSTSTSLALVKVDGYDDAFRTIDTCSVTGQPSDDLYDAVRLIDKNALKIYPTLQDKQELWSAARGSWKLQLATGGGKFRIFKSVPIFAFAMIDETNFGNGVGWNENSIWLSLLGPHFFNTARRQMVITIDDAFLLGGVIKLSNSLPGFVKEGMGLGKKPEDYAKTNTRPPAFTFIGASEKSLIARGGTGGIAIWTRLDNDIRQTAYPFE